jgi:hypothetical protein
VAKGLKERDWLRQGRKAGIFSNEDDRIGQELVRPG